MVLKRPLGFLELLSSLAVLFWMMSSMYLHTVAIFHTRRDERETPPSSAREVEVQLLVKVNSYSLKSTQRKSAGLFLQSDWSRVRGTLGDTWGVNSNRVNSC